MAVVDVGLLHPRAYRGLGQIEIASDAPDRVARLAHQRNDLDLELLGERPTTAGLLASHRLHHDGHPLRGHTPDRGCPSNRVRPSIKRVAFGFTRFRNYRIRVLLYAGKPNWDLLATIRPR